MRKVLLLSIAIFYSVLLTQAQNGVAISNTAGDTPDASAILDIKSSNQGVLIPRVDITDLATPAPMSTVVTSLLVYNTNTTTGPGFFYWNGTAWVGVGSGSGVSELNDLSDAKAYTTAVFIGATSGNNATGTKNTGVGVSSLHSLTTGQENVAIGLNAGKSITTGNLNIMIGADINGTNPSSATISRELNIGNTIYATGLYTASPKIGIGHQDHFGNVNNAPNSTLTVTGSLSLAYEQNGSVTLDETNYTYFADNNAVITLPQANTCTGRIYIIKALGSSGATVNAHSGGTIDGSASISLTQYKYIMIQSGDGTSWWIIGQN